MRIIVAGNNKLACDVLEWLIQEREEVVGIVAEGRDMTEKDEEWEKPFIITAHSISEEEHIPLFVGNISRFAKEIKALNPDIISPFRHKGLVKKNILDIPEIVDSETGSRCCTNLHYGELPRYGGMSPGFWEIMNGEEKAGVTFQYMGEEFDTGPILDQKFIDLNRGEKILRLPNRKIIVRGLTDFEIYKESNNLAFCMYKEGYMLIASRKAKLRKQDLSKKLYYNTGETNDAKSKMIDIEKATDDEISRYVLAKYFPHFGFPKALYKGGEIELKLEDVR